MAEMRAELDKALLCKARSEGEASKHMGLVVGLETERDESMRLLKSSRAQVDALKAQLQEAQVEAVEAQVRAWCQGERERDREREAVSRTLCVCGYAYVRLGSQILPRTGRSLLLPFVLPALPLVESISGPSCHFE